MKDPDLQLIAERYAAVRSLVEQQPEQQDQPGLARQVATGYVKSQIPSIKDGKLGALPKMAAAGAKWGNRGAAAAKTAAGTSVGIGKLSTNIANPVGTVAGIGEFGAGMMQAKHMQKAVDAGEISAQDAQAELAASAKPKGDRKTKLIKSSSKPKKEATDINNMGEIYMEQMFNPSQVANEVAAYAISDPAGATLEWAIANVPSIQNHPQVVQFAQQLQGQVPAPAV
jgi:hypothetical protein